LWTATQKCASIDPKSKESTPKQSKCNNPPPKTPKSDCRVVWRSRTAISAATRGGLRRAEEPKWRFRRPKSKGLTPKQSKCNHPPPKTPKERLSCGLAPSDGNFSSNSRRNAARRAKMAVPPTKKQGINAKAIEMQQSTAKNAERAIVVRFCNGAMSSTCKSQRDVWILETSRTGASVNPKIKRSALNLQANNNKLPTSPKKRI
jgi:hypothetical protein